MIDNKKEPTLPLTEIASMASANAGGLQSGDYTPQKTSHKGAVSTVYGSHLITDREEMPAQQIHLLQRSEDTGVMSNSQAEDGSLPVTPVQALAPTLAPAKQDDQEVAEFQDGDGAARRLNSNEYGSSQCEPNSAVFYGSKLASTGNLSV